MTAPPQHMRRYKVSPHVEFGLFQLSDDVQAGAPSSHDMPRDRLFLSDFGGAQFISASTDFFPAVVLEVWAGEPPTGQGDWDRVEESDFESQYGRMRFRSVNHATFGEVVDLPGPGIYEIRVHCRGREQAAALRGVEFNFHGVEEWLIQIWPVRRRRR